MGSTSVVDIAHCRVIGNRDGVDYVAGSGGTLDASLFADNTDDDIDLNGRIDARMFDNVTRDNHDDGIEFRLYAYENLLDGQTHLALVHGDVQGANRSSCGFTASA